MTSYEEKNALPPTEALPGGVFPDEIAVIKKKARGENTSRLKIGIAVGSVVLVILVVVGGTLLGVHLNRKPTVVVRSVQLAIEDEIMEETVEVDKEKDTETFRTVSSTGTSFVIKDTKRGLSAYRFDGDEKCYVLSESLAETDDVKELFEDLEKMEEDEVKVATRREDMFLSVDEDRGQVDRSELSESMAEFCEGLKTHWAVQSSSDPTPTPAVTPVAVIEKDGPAASAPTAGAEVESSTVMGEDVLSGINGTNAVHQREKRSPCSCCRGCFYCHCRQFTATVCGWCRTRTCIGWHRGRCFAWVIRTEWCCRIYHLEYCNGCRRYG